MGAGRQTGRKPSTKAPRKLIRTNAAVGPEALGITCVQVQDRDGTPRLHPNQGVMTLPGAPKKVSKGKRRRRRGAKRKLTFNVRDDTFEEGFCAWCGNLTTNKCDNSDEHSDGIPRFVCEKGCEKGECFCGVKFCKGCSHTSNPDMCCSHNLQRQ